MWKNNDRKFRKFKDFMMVIVMITGNREQSTNFDSVCIPVKTPTKVVTFSDEETIEFDSLEYNEDDENEVCCYTFET